MFSGTLGFLGLLKCQGTITLPPSFSRSIHADIEFVNFDGLNDFSPLGVFLGRIIRSIKLEDMVSIWFELRLDGPYSNTVIP